MTENRRWESDERGRGIAAGSPFTDGVTALRDAMARPDWVAEEPDVHMLPHIRRAAARLGRFRLIAAALESDGVYAVRLQSLWDETARDRREAIFAIVGAFAEGSTHVRERAVDGAVEFDVTTGLLDDQTRFRTHGHLVRLRVEPAHARRG